MESITAKEPKINAFETKQLFPSPVTFIKWTEVDDLNHRLGDLINNEKSKNPGVKVSNVGGWHSEYELFERNLPEIRRFKEMIITLLKSYYDNFESDLPDDFHSHWEIESWANVNTKGNTNVSHEHTKNNNQWSGVYYLKPGLDEQKISGLTVFEDRHYSGNGHTLNRIPRFNNNGKVLPSEFSIVPEKGLMVLFPGTLWHRVERYEGDERITIAFNARNKYLTLYSFNNGANSRFKTLMWYNFRGIMRPLAFLKRKLNVFN